MYVLRLIHCSYLYGVLSTWCCKLHDSSAVVRTPVYFISYRQTRSIPFSCAPFPGHPAAETVSVDPLRNAVLRFKEMGLICETPEASIAVADSARLQDLTMDLVEFCR